MLKHRSVWLIAPSLTVAASFAVLLADAGMAATCEPLAVHEGIYPLAPGERAPDAAGVEAACASAQPNADAKIGYALATALYHLKRGEEAAKALEQSVAAQRPESIALMGHLY